ncbi:MAG: hypothetical protein LUE31_09745 [Lachnospiraceae bacterium]|nr:hypothetical protein [Lachnospiraceae bacterium]
MMTKEKAFEGNVIYESGICVSVSAGRAGYQLYPAAKNEKLLADAGQFVFLWLGRTGIPASYGGVDSVQLFICMEDE